MAQNEMKAKPALPERVRSMEGLGLRDERRFTVFANPSVFAYQLLAIWTTDVRFRRNEKLCCLSFRKPAGL